MKVSEFIQKLLLVADPDAEVVIQDTEYDDEMGFYAAADFYVQEVKETDDWISLEDKEKPTKMIVIS